NKDQEEDDQADQGGPQVIEGIQVRAAIEIADLWAEPRRTALDGQGADGGQHRLADGLQHLLAGARLAALEVDLGTQLVLVEGPVGKVRRHENVGGQAAIVELPVGRGAVHRGGAHQGGRLEARRDTAAQGSAIQVDHADGRLGTPAAEQEVEQCENQQRGDEQQGQRSAVVPELRKNPHGDGADPARTHASSPTAWGVCAESLRKASSSRSTPARRRRSLALPSASSFPNRIRPSRWVRSASSMTWLETM